MKILCVIAPRDVIGRASNFVTAWQDGREFIANHLTETFKTSTDQVAKLRQRGFTHVEIHDYQGRSRAIQRIHTVND